MKTSVHVRPLPANLLALALTFVATALLQAQTTSTYIQSAANAQWGNAANWSPAGIPNGTDAVVNLSSVALYCANTPENQALSNGVPNFPFVFGNLNLGGGGVGAAANTNHQLRAAVSSGVPVISGNGGAYFRLSGNQGVIYQNNNATALLEYRYNTLSNYLNGNSEIAGGAVVEINGDYQFGNATNAVIVHDGGTLTSRSSEVQGGTGFMAVPSWRKILLDAANVPATFGTYSGYRWTIQCPIGELTPGSGFQMAKIPWSTTYTAGPIYFGGANTYTGPTVLSYGTLTLSNQFAVQYSTLTPNTGGTVIFDAGVVANAFYAGGLAGNGLLMLSNNFATSTPITLTVGGNSADTTYSGRLLGFAKGGTLVKVGTGILTLAGTADNSYGFLNVSNGTVVLGKNSTGSVHANGSGVTINGGAVQLGGYGGDQIFNSAIVTLNGGAFDLAGQTETIGGLIGTGGSLGDSLGYGTLTVNVANGTAMTNGSTLTGGNLVFGGPGTQVFVGVDNRDPAYGLATTVTGGIFQLGTGGVVIPVGGNTGITVNSPGTLSFLFGGTATFTNNINGSGHIAQNGSGTLVLSGSDTHTGNTLVNTGTLALPSGGTTVGGSVITVASNATLNVTAGALTLNTGQNLNGLGTVTGSFSAASGATNSGNLTLNGSVTLQAGAVLNPGAPASAGTISINGAIVNAGGYTLLYNLAPTTTPGGGTNALLVVSGNLNVGSGGNAAKLLITGSPLNGTYVLATFGTFSGTVGDVQITGVSGRQTYTLQTSGNQLQLVVGGQAAQGIVWLGDGAANVWDANNTGNLDWTNSALNSLAYFAQSDIVIFDNTSPNLTVNLTGDLIPQLGSVVLVNSSNNYTFTGSGHIDGPATSLTKTNSGTLTIDTANTFTGPVNLNGGVVSVATVAANGAASPLGAGSTLAFNGGTLQYTGPNANGAAFNRAVSIGAPGATVDQSGSGYLYIAGLISGSGSLTKVGGSQLAISGNNPGYTNITYVKEGQLQLRNAGALGTNNSLVIVTNAGASLAAGGGVTGTIPKALTLNGDGNGNGALQANDSGTAVTFSGAINLVTNDLGAGASIGGNAAGTLSGVVSGPGTLTKVGTGTFTLANNNTYTGGTVINGGTLQLGIGAGGGNNGWFGPIAASSVLTDNGCLAINHTNNVALTNTISGTGWLSQIGSGTLTLGASNDFAGGNIFSYPSMNYSFTASVSVSAGTLLVTNSYALGTVGAVDASKMQLAGNINIPAPLVVWGAASLENVSGTNTLSGQVNGIYGAGNWIIGSTAGLLAISTFNNAIGNATYGRTLQFQGAGSVIVTNILDASSALVGQAGNYLQLQKDGTGTLTIAGPADLPRGLYVNAGTLVIDANGSINGGGASSLLSCTVTNGKLVVNGSLTLSPSVTANVSGLIGGNGTINGPVTVQAGGTLSPSAGTGTNTSALTITGNLNFGGNLTAALNKALVLSNDVVNAGGAVNNTATGTVTATNYGPALVVGDTFTLFNQPVSGGAALNISRIVRGTQGQYVTWTNNLAVNGSISVLSVALLGTNAYLTSLALNPADNLTPSFVTNLFAYFATNAFGVAPTLTVTDASLTASNALFLNGTFLGPIASGVPSAALTNLGVGSTNVLKVLVTAQDAVTTNLYTINLTQLSVNTNAFTIGSSVSNNSLSLSWPPDRLGWRLWVQTNSLSTGLSTNWSVWPNGTTVTNVSVPISPANPSVFFRMTYP